MCQAQSSGVSLSRLYSAAVGKTLAGLLLDLQLTIRSASKRAYAVLEPAVVVSGRGRVGAQKVGCAAPLDGEVGCAAPPDAEPACAAALSGFLPDGDTDAERAAMGCAGTTKAAVGCAAPHAGDAGGETSQSAFPESEPDVRGPAMACAGRP